MTIQVAINGCGRIGRSILHTLATTRSGVEAAPLNGVTPLETLTAPELACLFGWDDSK